MSPHHSRVGASNEVEPDRYGGLRGAVAGPLQRLCKLDLELFEQGRPTVAVTRRGEVLIDPDSTPTPVNQDDQLVNRGLVDVIAPWVMEAGGMAPDLQMPRPQLRIFPRRLGGAPHVVATRIETQSIYALSSRGFSMEKLAVLYPALSRDQLSQAIDLEEQLQQNLRMAA